MIKYLFVTINSLALFFFSLFLDNGTVSVKGNFPSNIKPGTEVTAELIVTKGTMGGFAKLQIEVPEGVTVKEADSKGATFSFTGGIGKWIWTGVPSEAEFTVKLVLVADANVSGTKTIGAKYSYVENNNKQIVEMPPTEVVFGEGSATPVVNAAEPTTQPVVNTPTVEPTTTAKTAEPTPTIATGDEPNSLVTVSRTITKGATANDWMINLKIKKDGIKGFARYSDVLPAGFTAKQDKINGSSFSVADGKIKFVWVNVPTEPDLEISYVLSGTHKDNINLEGEFSYLESNQSKFYKLQAEKLPLFETPVTETKTETPVTTTQPVTETKTETPATETKTETPVTTTQPVTETKTETPAIETKTETPTNTQPSIETASKTGGDVSYCVQIGAYTNAAVTSSKLSGMYGISENIRSEMNGGFTKFMVGKFMEYRLARNHRETVKGKGVNGAFVTAYNGPVRITVQEALMISSQKWVR
ncbi:MAG: SPOR domain-containing protein [Bacteroidia bacterium]|nr:SPOR domain-containing protein [Bacteroidia bacterium]